MEEVFVNMGQICSMTSSGILTTVGLGSCVGVVLYDQAAKVGAMGHVFLPHTRGKDGSNASPGKYADTAIPALIEQAINAGAQRRRLIAKIAGGANLFANLTTANIGEQNITAVTEHLSAHNIPIVGRDVAGNHGRKMRFFIENGKVTVTAIGKEPIEI